MKKKASKILLTVLTLTAISIPTYASNQMPTKFNATTIQDIRNVEEEMQQVMQICNEMDTPKNILLVDNGYVVGEVHTDGYVISYECFLLGKHTVERVCSGLSPLRRDRLWC